MKEILEDRLVENGTKEILTADERRDTLNTAIVFGQSEDDLRREFKQFKTLKLFRKLTLDLTDVKDGTVFEDRISEAIAYGFGSVLVFTSDLKRVKEKLGNADVKVFVAVCYPFGEDGVGVKKLAVKRAIAKGADEILLPVGCVAIKRGNYDAVKREFKRCVKINKRVKISAMTECGELTAEEIEKTIKILNGVGVKSFCSGSGFCRSGDGNEYKLMRSATKADSELIAFDKGGKNEVVNLLHSVDGVICADGAKIAEEIRSRLE